MRFLFFFFLCSFMCFGFTEESSFETAPSQEGDDIAMQIQKNLKKDNFFNASEEKRLSSIEKELKELKKQNIPEQKSLILAEARGLLASGLYIIPEFTYWRANSMTYPFAITFQDNQTDPVTIEKYKKHKLSYKPSFKVILGANLPYDYWDMSGSYVYFNSSEKKTLNAADDLKLDDIVTENIVITSPIDTIVNKYKVIYQMADLQIARACFLSKYLSMRLFGGLKGGNIYQRMSATDYYEASDQQGPYFATYKSRTYQRYWGIGPEIGLCTKGFFGNSGFTIFFDGSIATLYGTNKIVNKQHISARGLSYYAILFTDKFQLLTPLFNYMIGLSWEKRWIDKKYFLQIHAGWEETIVEKLSNYASITSIANDYNGDFSLKGLTTGMKFDF